MTSLILNNWALLHNKICCAGIIIVRFEEPCGTGHEICSLEYFLIAFCVSWGWMDGMWIKSIRVIDLTS